MAQYTVSSESDLRALIDSASPDDKIMIEAGNYNYSSQLRIENGGTADSPVIITGPSDARDTSTPNATIEMSGNNDPAIELRDSHIHLKNIELSGSDDKGINTHADNTVIEQCNVHGSSRWAIMNNGGDNVVYRNCDSHDNYSYGADADGFNMTAGGGEPARNCLIEGCRAWNNSHDGFDMWVSEGHTIRDCMAWKNGINEYSDGEGNGFKLGGNDVGGGHLIYRCVTWDNLQRGFDWNTTNNPLTIYNCTAYNERISYRLREVEHIMRNNLAIDCDRTIVDSVVDDQYNSWNLNINDPQVESKNPDSDSFLRLSAGSPCIDAGTIVDPINYEASAPDLGAFEYTSGNESSPADSGATMKVYNGSSWTEITNVKLT